MAPVAHQHEVRYAPVLVALSHVAAAVYLTFTVGSGLYQSFKALPPAQDTRHRIHRRRILAPIFGGLALLALAANAYYQLGYLTLSYKVWADEHDIAVPESVFRTISSDGTTRVPLYLTQWLTDTAIYHDASEIVAEKARRFWWGNQAVLATVPWSMLLSIEGRRRNLSYLWAYMALAHLVNLSFAQNLFYLALLLTPSPLGQNIPRWAPRLSNAVNALFPPKPTNWHPSPVLYIFTLTLTYSVLFLLPYSANTSSFGTVNTLARLSTFLPLLLPTITPQSWGSHQSNPHASYKMYSRVFRFISVTSTLLNAKTGLEAILYNLPGAWKHRHSLRVPFDVQRRTNWDRTTTAVGKVLGSMSDHPVVGAVAADVVISAAALGIWAAVRAIGVDEILGSAVPFYRAAVTREQLMRAVVKQEEESDEKGVIMARLAQSSPVRTVTRSGRTVRPSSKMIADGSGSSSKDADDSPATGTRRRGRPRKIRAEAEAEPEHGPALASETEAKATDATYIPEPGVAAEVAEGDRVEVEDDWEAAAVTWGLTALGGLGAGSAGVFGGECIAR